MQRIEDYNSPVRPDDELTDPMDSWELAAADQLLLEVARAVYRKRDEQYGESYSHHARTSQMWTTYLGTRVTPAQVSVMFILDKIVRSKAQDKPDHWLDVCGYAMMHTSVQAAEERVDRLMDEYRKKVVQDND